jgi:lipopolysaccharide transport system permease protein
MFETDSALIAPPTQRDSDPLRDDPGVGAIDAGDEPEALHETIIRPQTGWIGIDWWEMWSHRELLVFLIKRDISVRYKQTILGPAWAVFQPLIMMAIFTVIFGRFAGLDSEGFPYTVFVFAGLIPWMLFSQGLSQSALSLVNQQQLLTKVYFPRLFIPVAAACVFLVDLLISLVLYLPIMLYYGVAPSGGIIWVPLLALLTLIATLGFGVTLAALTVFYRDFKHIVPFLVQILMYVSPVIYSAGIAGPRWGLILSLNPMFGIIDAFRSAILGLPWHIPSLAISTASALGLFTFGIFYFRKTERRFADFA